MAAEEAELEELRQAIVAKAVLIEMLKKERNAAQQHVASTHVLLRESVIQAGLDNAHQHDSESLFMDGLSSDFERLVSTSPVRPARGTSYTAKSIEVD